MHEVLNSLIFVSLLKITLGVTTNFTNITTVTLINFTANFHSSNYYYAHYWFQLMKKPDFKEEMLI